MQPWGDTVTGSTEDIGTWSEASPRQVLRAGVLLQAVCAWLLMHSAPLFHLQQKDSDFSW